jgi:hypothetical protein
VLFSLLMTDFTQPILAEVVNAKPELALAAFVSAEQALQVVLRDSGDKYHPRYRGIGGVGLAFVVRPDIPNSEQLDPSVPATFGPSLFRVNNQDSQPDAWKPQPTDRKMYGAEMPDEPGRFTVFALAKVKLLARRIGFPYSYVVDETDVQPKEFGNAGGERINGTVQAVSGLWQVHDQLVGRAIREYIQSARRDEPQPASVDQMAERFQREFVQTSGLLLGRRPDDLSRPETNLFLNVVMTTTAQNKYHTNG